MRVIIILIRQFFQYKLKVFQKLFLLKNCGHLLHKNVIFTRTVTKFCKDCPLCFCYCCSQFNHFSSTREWMTKCGNSCPQTRTPLNFLDWRQNKKILKLQHVLWNRNNECNSNGVGLEYKLEYKKDSNTNKINKIRASWSAKTTQTTFLISALLFIIWPNTRCSFLVSKKGYLTETLERLTWGLRSMLFLRAITNTMDVVTLNNKI